MPFDSNAPLEFWVFVLGPAVEMDSSGFTPRGKDSCSFPSCAAGTPPPSVLTLVARRLFREGDEWFLDVAFKLARDDFGSVFAESSFR